MARFRPNVVVRGCPAFAEDGWNTLQVVDNSAHPLTLQAFKPCNRCGVVNVDTVHLQFTRFDCAGMSYNCSNLF
jgi:uncharacterized protein YcbX